MLKSTFIAILFIFVTSSAFAENGPAAPTVFVSKEKSEVQKTEVQASKQKASAQASSTSTFASESKEAVAKKKEQEEANLKAKEEALEAEKNAIEKKTKGVVTGVSKQGFAVQYAADAKEGGKEIWFNFAEKMELVKMKDTSELGEGDMVSVLYGEMPDHRKLVKKIELIKKKPEEKKSAKASEEKES